jgi:hypothetical protein
MTEGNKEGTLPEPAKLPSRDRYRGLREWTTLVISLVGLSSIWFAILQMREADRSALISAYAGVASQWLEVDKAILTYPELRKYFSGQKLESSDPNRDRVLAISDLALDAMDDMLSFGLLAGNARKMSGWRLTFQRLLQDSPATCDRFRQSAQLFSSEFSQLATKSCGLEPKTGH